MRYLPHTESDRRAMLAAIGAKDVESLFVDVPAAARLPGPLDLPKAQGEMEVERAFQRMAMKNLSAGCAPFFIGAGIYRHHIPAAIDQLLTRGEFLTSYTPYQPEVSQGTLQYLFEFQTQVALVTGMDVANASMYDGATACAEAAAMACRVTKRKKVILSGSLHPHYRSTTETALKYTDMAAETLAPDPLAMEDLMGRVDSATACVMVQNPGFFGHVRDLAPLAAACRESGALLVVAVAEPVSLGLIAPPGAMGADIVVGEGQSLGVGLSFGGPGLGLFATRDKYVRQMPGRLAGQTVDVDGKRGFVLTLSTREQHIRREKATSNICTNSGLCALAFTMHLTMLGETGFTRLAELNHAAAVRLEGKLARLKGVKVLPDSYFNEFAVHLGEDKDAAAVVDALAAKGILAGVPASRFYPDWPELHPVLILAATETNTDADMDALVAALQGVL
ncbi:aminomethyl-transferring glycine dehydrogenase subunit GcvPA [Magnetospirillum sp. UT-4]|uniref:aminomethyl-transferring glycine dehydrogenase subunit GcvPA n=1 Tax=Magnetospirillum sp. UT-4 TaxID=2681467 RepID=UPI00137D48A3|nr:aminomethyl-transferring glycine dehydrogenase subunit GcvPA [Magnetospirillum sp. UT-4]CAA7613414.1 putative glycine dehydrogenase (decarboxylating) subunit 1 [Magnetospirillum sp. UT-4]